MNAVPVCPLELIEPLGLLEHLELAGAQTTPFQYSLFVLSVYSVCGLCRKEGALLLLYCYGWLVTTCLLVLI